MKNKVLNLITTKKAQIQLTLDCNVKLTRTLSQQFTKNHLDQALVQLGTHGKRGYAFACLVEAPERYYKYDLVMTEHALELTASGLNFNLIAHSPMGLVLLNKIHAYLKKSPYVYVESRISEGLQAHGDCSNPHGQLSGHLTRLLASTGLSSAFTEENRTKQVSVFTLLRELQSILRIQEDPSNDLCSDAFWGFYGLFGYNLVFQFEKLVRVSNSDNGENDLHLFLPERLLVHEPQTETTFEISYTLQDLSAVQTSGLLCATNPPLKYLTEIPPDKTCDAKPIADFKTYVHSAQKRFAVGDLFEVVPSYEIPLKADANCSPHQLYQALMTTNPSPYCFMVGTGKEHVIGASPEMYLRSNGESIETCPISGTVARGKNALEDERQIHQLLSSSKDTFELTMCTDVDRNDKSRICEPGTVAIKGRRIIEVYSHLIHTVDWVTGKLRADCDAFDAFISHMWAVTVTGAPKADAIQWLEDHETTPRVWYGGAVGFCGFDGTLDTGLTIRTIRCEPYVNTTRVGATLLHHSDADEEELETQIKAAAMIQAVKSALEKPLLHGPHTQTRVFKSPSNTLTEMPTRVLMIDHRDSFVHTLADYFRQCGAQLTTLRYQDAQLQLSKPQLREAPPYDLVVLSPGPGSPQDFDLDTTLDLCVASGIPVFGVCLGLQAIVSYFGGKLSQLDLPRHGESSTIDVFQGSRLFRGLPKQFCVGRYHSLYASQLPECLRLTAVSEDQIPMAIEHQTLQISAVQFHPESLMTDSNIGLALITNVLTATTTSKKAGSDTMPLNNPNQHPQNQSLPLNHLVNKSVEGFALTKSELFEATLAIMDGRLSDIQTASLLTSLHYRGENAEELAGCAEALLSRCRNVSPSQPLILDTCGTGGDGLSTFNISTATAFVVAATGIPVAKHGNRAASGRTGSADVLEALGIPLDLSPESALALLNTHQLCFLFAPTYHPALAKVAGLRKELGFKTIFNMVGPLVNPAKPKLQVVGTPNLKTAKIMASSLASNKHNKALVVVGHGGMDEFSTTGENHVLHVKNGQVTSFIVTPEEAGLERSTLADLKGGDAACNAAMIHAILQGEPGFCTDVVLLNTAAALFLAEKSKDFYQGVQMARQALASGQALKILEAMKGGPTAC